MSICLASKSFSGDWSIDVVAQANAIGAGNVGLIPGLPNTTQSPKSRHRCDVSSALCCQDAKMRRWALPLVTGLGVTLRVYRRFDFFGFVAETSFSSELYSTNLLFFQFKCF